MSGRTGDGEGAIVTSDENAFRYAYIRQSSSQRSIQHKISHLTL